MALRFWCPLWPKSPHRKLCWKREPSYSQRNILCSLTRSTCGKSRLSNRRSLARMKPIKLPGPSSRSPKPKQIPYTLPFELTLHAAYSVQMNWGAYMWKGGQSKQLTRASPGRRLNSLLRLTSSSESTSTSTRSVPRPEWGKNLQTIMLANKPGNKKSWHTSDKRNIQMTRNTGLDSSGRNEPGMQDGLTAGINQPAVPPPDSTRNNRDPTD